jgi:hypothetical protein
MHTGTTVPAKVKVRETDLFISLAPALPFRARKKVREISLRSNAK